MFTLKKLVFHLKCLIYIVLLRNYRKEYFIKVIVGTTAPAVVDKPQCSIIPWSLVVIHEYSKYSDLANTTFRLRRRENGVHAPFTSRSLFAGSRVDDYDVKTYNLTSYRRRLKQIQFLDKNKELFLIFASQKIILA